MKDIFFQEKGKQILLSLASEDNQNVSQLSIGTKGTYAHTFNLLKDMEDSGIVLSRKTGRTRYIKLTKKGRKMAELLEMFTAVLNNKRVKKRSKNNKKKRTIATTNKKSVRGSSKSKEKKKMRT